LTWWEGGLEKGVGEEEGGEKERRSDADFHQAVSAVWALPKKKKTKQKPQQNQKPKTRNQNNKEASKRK